MLLQVMINWPKEQDKEYRNKFPYIRELYDKCIIVNQREKCE